MTQPVGRAREFPYELRTMCYIEVGLDGAVTWGDVTGADERASRGQSQLYAVWPGEWASHLFVIDDRRTRSRFRLHSRQEPDGPGGSPARSLVEVRYPRSESRAERGCT